MTDEEYLAELSSVCDRLDVLLANRPLRPIEDAWARGRLAAYLDLAKCAAWSAVCTMRNEAGRAA
jgi:hypothetical protein